MKRKFKSWVRKADKVAKFIIAAMLFLIAGLDKDCGWPEIFFAVTVIISAILDIAFTLKHSYELGLDD